MARFDISDAEPVYDGTKLAGYIRKHTADLWLPLDPAGENLSGPTYKADAQTIVILGATGQLERL